MARKFLRAYVYDDPEPALVEAVAAKFRAWNYDVRRLMNMLLRSTVFYSPRAYRALVKSPLDLVIGAHKLLGAEAVEPGVIFALARMGQVPMRPPNVAGWPGGALWLNTGTITARLNYLRNLGNVAVGLAPTVRAVGVSPTVEAAGPAPPVGPGPAAFNSDPWALVAGVSPSDAAAVADKLLFAVVQGDAAPEERKSIVDYLETDPSGERSGLNGENFEVKVRGALSLALTLPAYQLN